MRSLLSFVALACAAQTLVVSQASHSADERDFDWGWAVGECLVARCQVFRGVLTDMPTPGKGALITASEQLFGPPLKGQTILVPFASPDPGPRRGIPRSGLAGYLFAHVQRIETYRNPDMAGLTLARMVGSPGVPPFAWDAICSTARTKFPLMTPTGQVALLKRFVELAETPDPRVAVPALNEIETLKRYVSSLNEIAEPSELPNLSSAYREMVRQGKLLRSEILEAALHIRQ